MTNLFVGTAAHPAATAENTRAFAQAVSRPRTGLVARSTILFGSRLRMLAATRSFFCNNFFDISAREKILGMIRVSAKSPEGLSGDHCCRHAPFRHLVDGFTAGRCRRSPR